MGLAQHEDTIEARAPRATEEPLAGRVLPGGAAGRAQDGDLAHLDHARERLIVAEKPIRRLPKSNAVLARC